MQYVKSLVAALVAGLGAVATALEDNALSTQEIVTAAIAFLVALGAVYNIPYRASAPPTP